MIKTYSTLYTKDTLGNIRIWYMEQSENKFRTVSGLKNGETVVSEWTITEGKNVGKKNATTNESDLGEDQLKVVFANGKLVKEINFDTVRKNASL